MSVWSRMKRRLVYSQLLSANIGASKAFSATLWTVALLGLAALLILLPRSPLPWFDEILAQSTALSIARGHKEVPTVLAAFPCTKPFGVFYGPVGLGLGAASIKLFGTSLIAWRAIGWLGAVAIALLSSWITQLLTGSRAASAATAALVVFSQGLGARATSGRLDTVCLSLELAAMGFAILVLQQPVKRSRQYCAVLAGVFCGLAILSTPRSFTFIFGLFIAFFVELIAERRHSRALLWALITAGCPITILILLWTALQRTDPLHWFGFIVAVSHGDKVNVSPLMGGAWHLLDGPILERAAGFCFLLVLVMVLATSWRALRMHKVDNSLGYRSLRLALITGLMNYLLTFMLISRFWDHDIFVVPIFLPVIVSLSMHVLRERSLRLHAISVLSAWFIWVGTCLLIRSGKIVVWAHSYSQRDSAALTRFVAEHVPQQALVFGPRDYYYYAVENSGSQYLYARPWVSTGLIEDIVATRPHWDQFLATKSVYLIWPVGSKVPEELLANHLAEIGRFEPARADGSRLLEMIGISDEGYPPTLLYRVISSEKSLGAYQGSASNCRDKSSATAFAK